MVSVLVTGGAGFIGSHTCKALAAAGYEPVAYDNLEHGHAGAVRWGPLIVGDIGDSKTLDLTLATHSPSAIIHFAAYAYVGESVTDPSKYYRNNFANTVILLDSCRRAGIQNVVFSSSCATYGSPQQLPISETTLQSPINPYGRTKLMVEQMLLDYDAAYHIRHVALRYFNAAGADPDGELAERHSPETHLIPRALLAAAGEIPVLEIFGDDYPTPDGTCVRDYIHVTDLAAAHVLALNDLLSGGLSLALNLGTGVGISIREIIATIERVTGRKVPVVFVPRRSGDPAALYADPALARSRLGFVPIHSTIETIVRTAAPHFGLPVIA